ncbi:DinB family protein [Winogradskyella sp. 3972H.M.0a.05]|uniref:DinB family protein n=1 Tax=Winogradskyella sp. 3972H.M.0a.05 TaxID=2950277 RepID=UPI003397FB9C
MIKDTLIKLFTRDLNKLKTELESYKDEANMWLVPEGISNCAGNLGLHIVGNLKHFIGAQLGDTGYIRQRDLEFSLKDVPRQEILKQIDETIVDVTTALEKLPEADLQEEYRRNPFEDYMTTEYFLVHLIMHLSYHLGQINYHRRLLE